MKRTGCDDADLFLLASVAYRFGDEQDAARLFKISGGITRSGVDRLSENASYHEIEPLLHHVADDCSQSGHALDLPPELPARWSQVHLRETARSAVIQYGAVKALTALADAGVRVIPLKGFYLAPRFYAKQGARSYRDLDLLVEPASLSDLNDALLSAGFQPQPGRPSFVPAPAYTVYSLVMEGSDASMEIDIHVGMHWPEEYERRTAFAAADLWSHAVQEKIEGVPLWALSPEHLAITTLLDVAVNHRYARLCKFRDLVEIMRGCELDWEAVALWAERWKVRSFVGPGLRMLAEIDPSLSIPAEVTDSICPSYAALRMFSKALATTALPDHRSRTFTPANLLFFILADTPRERMRGLLHVPSHMLRGRRRF